MRLTAEDFPPELRQEARNYLRRPRTRRPGARRRSAVPVAAPAVVRRVSPELLSMWAVMAGQQETPSADNTRGLSTSTVLGGFDGCNTDGA
jgi:hypothetical protein